MGNVNAQILTVNPRRRPKTFQKHRKCPNYNRPKSLKATDIIAYGETIGRSHKYRPDAESVEQISVKLLLTFSERMNFARVPGDARRAIMFVAFGDYLVLPQNL